MRRKTLNFPSGKLATSWFTTVPVDGKFDASRKIPFFFFFIIYLLEYLQSILVENFQ